MRAVALVLLLAAPSTAFAERGLRRNDGGLVLSAGAELAVTHVRLSGPDPDGRISGDITGAGTLFALLTMVQLDYNFARDLGVGVRLAGGRIFNSDDRIFDFASEADADGIAAQILFGPTLTYYPWRSFYVAADVFLQILSFDNVGAKVSGGGRLEERAIREIDGELVVGFELGVRLGLVFEIVGIVAIAPELRIGVQPVAVAKKGADLFYVAPDRSVDVQAERLLTVGGGVGVGIRLFF